MASNSATNNLSLKLLIDTKKNKVLFAEASKDVVDFLFTLLQLPLATVVKLLTKEDVVGSLGNLYSSVENLNPDYIQPNLSKDLLLNPIILPSSPSISGLLTSVAAINKPSQITPKLYKCNHGCRGGSNTVTEVYNSFCNNYSGCGGRMTIEVKYMIMDDLDIQPSMSAISSITMLNQFNVKDVGVLKEAVFQLGINEGLKLLKASMETKTVLTSVFLAS
ncbi:hypothetical protein PIB30_013260 [Stylosanthes scabra]|uniref:DUF674 domain-containing protein n=1 Tax=Stylosanthes scabra TaxID=79078 RepID=A0ABU6R668_9FABA|nr:hypothetical protein [Stylosanthes scabra]